MQDAQQEAGNGEQHGQDDGDEAFCVCHDLFFPKSKD
jgi:hypothetical protein